VPPDPEALTAETILAFLKHKQDMMDAGELSPRTFQGYKKTAELLGSNFRRKRLVSDLQTDDFADLRNKMARRWAPRRLAKMIQYVRSVFKHG
jgi:hypothetical protein